MHNRFLGKVVVITGGGSGLGEWMAKGFAEAGADLVITSNNITECRKVAADISKSKGDIIACEMDVTNNESIKNALETILKRFGRVDVLINNAGLVWKRKVLEVDEEFFSQMNDVNVKGAFFCSQIFGEQMIKQRYGKIINITSAAGKLIRKGLANPIYNMNKAAINMMTKALAEEWAEFNINVNAIGPGYFDTDPVKERLKDPLVYKTIIDSTPLARIGTSHDIAETAIFLASDASSFITGQVIYVDGGRTIL